MKKLNPQKYKGIEFICLNDLPMDSREGFFEWIDKRSVISIQFHDKILRDCVQYSDYEYWYNNIHLGKNMPPPKKEKSKFRKFIKLALSR